MSEMPGGAAGVPQILSRAFWRGPLAILFLGLVTVGVSRSMLFAVLPPIAREIGLTEVLVGLMFAAAAAMFALTSPVWGRVADARGRVFVIAAGLCGFGLMMLPFTGAIALAQTGLLPMWAVFLALFVPRVLSAAASAAVFPGAQAYVADTTSAIDRTAGTSLVAAAMGFGLVAGPGLAGLMAGFGLLTPMYMAAGLGILGGIMAWRLLPEPPRRVRRDGEDAVLPLRLRDKRIIAMLPLSASISMMVAVTQQTSAFYFQDILGLDAAGTAQATGTALMAMAGATLLVQTMIVQRFRLTPPVLIYSGLVLGIAAYAVLTLAGSFLTLTTGLVMVGVAFGMANPGIAAAISLSVSPDEQGQAAGFNSSMSATGFMVGSLVGPGGYTVMADLPHYFGLTALSLMLTAALFYSFPRPDVHPGGAGEVHGRLTFPTFDRRGAMAILRRQSRAVPYRQGPRFDFPAVFGAFPAHSGSDARLPILNEQRHEHVQAHQRQVQDRPPHGREHLGSPQEPVQHAPVWSR